MAGPAGSGRKATIIRTDEWEEMRGYEDVPHRARRIAWVSMGGVLILLAGALGIADGVLVIGLGAELDLLDADSVVCSTMMMLFGLVAVMGGIMAILRMHFPLALVGGACGMLAYGCALGPVLAIIGLVMVVLMRREFGR